MHIHFILCARSLRCVCLDPCHQVTLGSLCMQHASTCLTLWRALACYNTSISIRAVYIDAKPCQCAIAHQTWNSAKFSLWKWGIPIAVFSRRKLGENSVWCAIMHPRRSAARFPPWKKGELLPDFRYGNLATIPNTLGKHRSRPHPFRNQTSKPNAFKASKANANSLYLIANVQKLWFYQNKGLPTKRHYGVFNTFPTSN